MVGDVAVAASATLVSAMATQAWQTARAEVAQVFGQSGPDRQSAIETQLDQNAARVEQAADPDQIRQALLTVWKVQWTALLRQHPDSVAEVDSLVARIREALSPEQRDWVRTSIEREQATQHRPKQKALENVDTGGIAPGGFYRMGGGMGMGMRMGGLGMGRMGGIEDRLDTEDQPDQPDDEDRPD